MNILSAVKQTIEGAVFSGFTATPKLKSLVGEKTANTIAAVASHPFTSAAAVATVLNPGAALSTTKAISSKVSSSFAAAPLKTQLAVGVGGLVGTGAILKNPSLVSKAADIPSGLVNLGGNVGEFIESPSIEKAKDIVTENPLLSGAIGGAGLLAVGVGAGAIANTTATYLNTKAIKENTNTVISPPSGTKNTDKVLVPDTAITKALAPPPLDSSVPEPSEITPTKTQETGTIKNQNKVNILIANQTKSTRNRNIYIHHKHKRRK